MTPSNGSFRHCRSSSADAPPFRRLRRHSRLHVHAGNNTQTLRHPEMKSASRCFPETRMSATCNFPETPGSRTPAGGSPLRAHARVRNGGQIRLARGGLGVLPVCVRVRPECEHGRTPNEAREDDSVPDLIIFLCCSANMPPTPSNARFRRRLRLPEEFIEDGRAPGGQGFHVRAENGLLHEATESLGHCPLPVLPAGPGPLAEHQLDNSVAILDARTLRI